MKICCVTRWPSMPMGIVTWVPNFMKSLLKHDCEIYLIALCEGDQQPILNGVEVLSLPIKDFLPNIHYYCSTISKKITDIIKKMNADLIHVNYINYPLVATILAKKQTKKVLVASPHGYDITQIPFDSYASSITKTCISEVDRIVTASSDFALRVSNYLEFPYSNIRVVPHGVDTDFFHPNVSGMEIRNKFNLENSKVVLYLGRLSVEKGIHDIISSMKILKEDIHEIKLLLAGGCDAYYMSVLDHLIEKFNLKKNVVLSGPINYESLPPFYAAGDVFAFTPIGPEHFGLVLLEAMAMGIPIVTTNVGGIPEIVNDGQTGLLVEVANYQALANAMKKVLNNKVFAYGLAKKARKSVEDKFTWDLCAKRMIKVYEELLYSSKNEIE